MHNANYSTPGYFLRRSNSVLSCTATITPRVSTRKKYESLQQLQERSRRRHEAELKMKGKCDSPWPQFLMYWARDTSEG
ncbi:hypothetical protein T02_818 [Trichinella nativa]|uniref:Uncharacterized protein n=1 Tax=Trichinella nativa TaxID=6335 RepID=A0A0V1L4M8_9BILA|nr:hypothetical protein T02_818 [Trichinella nativa]